MAEPNTLPNGTAPSGAPNVTQRILAQYIRDLSFENMLAQKGLTGEVQHEIGVQVSLDARKRAGDKQYEVSTKLTITNKSKTSGDILFVLEIDHAGLFMIDGLTDDLLRPYLFIECPRMTFPFLRRIVSDVTRDGGFPPLNLDTIDFLALYRKDIARRVQSGAAEAGQPEKLDS